MCGRSWRGTARPAAGSRGSTTQAAGERSVVDGLRANRSRTRSDGPGYGTHVACHMVGRKARRDHGPHHVGTSSLEPPASRGKVVPMQPSLELKNFTILVQSKRANINA